MKLKEKSPRPCASIRPETIQGKFHCRYRRRRQNGNEKSGEPIQVVEMRLLDIQGLTLTLKPFPEFEKIGVSEHPLQSFVILGKWSVIQR
ncbi:MAG: hypothetical protein HYZ89_05315 [Candidatus Omnitrophica bacterium]|nr:hypothetical protein [Candidatus Omnitrophota bacterium]